MKSGLLALALGQIVQIGQILYGLLMGAGRFLFQQVNDFSRMGCKKYGLSVEMTHWVSAACWTPGDLLDKIIQSGLAEGSRGNSGRSAIGRAAL